MIVKLMDSDWTNVTFPEGYEPPVEEVEYQVVGYSYSEGEKKGYELAGFEGTLFRVERFKIVNDHFIPDSVIDGTPMARVSMYASFTFPTSSMGKMPRKKKKQFTKRGITFTHKGDDKYTP